MAVFNLNQARLVWTAQRVFFSIKAASQAQLGNSICPCVYVCVMCI